jgi:uroporphyrinogen III methyltransferase / synthase
MPGKVYLVGAGPGGKAQLTLRGQQLLSEAEVLVYDALVDEELLQFVAEDCLCLDVGKRGGRISAKQDDINQLLVSYCQQGKQVVRLKSGDPLIFGRGIHEIQALQTAGCSFEVVPGISSALAAPLMAGIPLTHPTLSRCVTILTAHAPEELEWRALARMETLVILMAGHRLAEIVLNLQDYGKSPQTAIAIVRWAGRPEQTIWRGTLATITQQTAGEVLSPAVMVVGDVAGLDLMPPQLQVEQQVATQPLVGKTVLVTRSLEQSSEFSDRLRAAGASVLEMPALAITPPSSWQALDQAIAEIDTYDWLILTSANGVTAFMERLFTAGKDGRSLAGLKIAVVGRKTAACLQQQGLRPDFVPPNFVADALIEHFPESERWSALKLLFPRVETGGRDVLVTDLRAKGAEIVEVPAYESRCPVSLDPSVEHALRCRAVDVITFASSKTVQNFYQLLERTRPSENSTWQEELDGVCIASIGPQTSKTCLQRLGRVDLEAQEYTLEGLTQGIIEYYRGT